MSEPLDVLGVSEIAELAGVHEVTVWRWRQRGMTPDVVLRSGPVWRRSTVETWLAASAADREKFHPKHLDGEPVQ